MDIAKRGKGRFNRQSGKLGGIKGGPARAAKLSPERRSEIARLAAEARWSGSTKADKASQGS